MMRKIKKSPPCAKWRGGIFYAQKLPARKGGISLYFAFSAMDLGVWMCYTYRECDRAKSDRRTKDEDLQEFVDNGVALPDVGIFGNAVYVE